MKFIKNTKFRSGLTLLAFAAAMASCSSDDDNNITATPPASPVEEPLALTQVFNKFALEDRTEGGDNAATNNPSGIDNGYATIQRTDEDGRYYLNITDFNNVNAPIDRNHPNIEASKFAVFLTTAGASLSAQGNFDEGDLPIYIGTIDANGEVKLRLTPEEVTGNTVTLGGVTVNVRNSADVQLTSEGDVKAQRSTGSRNSWYDWIVLHPFQGENLRPTSYPGIVADLDADHQLDQNITTRYNKFKLEDRTDSDAVANPSGIDNGYASIVSYDDATFIRLNDFANVGELIDFRHPNITASRFAVFVTTAGAGLGVQNGFDEGDRPVYIGELSTNGFNDIELKPATENASGTVSLGANGVAINTNPNIVLENGFIASQMSTGSRATKYDWIVLHPFQGENLRPVSYPSIVADLDGANELEQNQ